jgi:hypothetical protein
MDSVPIELQVFAIVVIVLGIVVTAIVYYLAAREWKDPRVACYWENLGCMYFMFAAVILVIVAMLLVFALTHPPTKMSGAVPTAFAPSWDSTPLDRLSPKQTL